MMELKCTGSNSSTVVLLATSRTPTWDGPGPPPDEPSSLLKTIRLIFYSNTICY